MLIRLIGIVFSGLLLVSCKLHVTVDGLEDDLTLIELKSGKTLTLTNNELATFDHNFSAFSAYDVQIEEHSGQTCHLVYKSGRFSTPYTEMEVNCTAIESSFSCTSDSQPICVRIDNPAVCNDGELCLDQKYQTFTNRCKANASGLNPITIGLDECQVIDNELSTSNTPVTLIETTPVKDSKITVVSATFNDNLATITIEHDGSCESDIYALEVDKFDQDAQRVEWSISYSRAHCATFVTKDIIFDLMPIREWYYQQNGKATGTVNLPGIGTYSF